MATAKPIIRTGMDRPLYYYRGFRLVRLARGGLGERLAAADDVRLAAFSKRNLVAAFFWSAPYRSWISRYRATLFIYRCNDCAFLSGQCDRGIATIALPRMVTFAAVLNFAIWRLNSSAT